MRKGFTLVELLVFIGIFTVIIGSFIAILVSVINIQTQQIGVNQAEQQGQFLAQQLQYYIQSARFVDMTADTSTSTLTLREFSSTNDPTIFSVSNGIMYIQQGVNGALQPLTSSKVTISNATFTRHNNTNSAGAAQGVDSVSYSFTVTGGVGADVSVQSFQSSVSVLVPVNTITLVQQAKTEGNSGSVSTLSAHYASNNEAGNLLIAVVANKGAVTSSIIDTNDNNWVMEASATNAAYSEKLTVYAAANSVIGSNTTTVTFNSGASFASLYIYEYRGAVGTFDTWAAAAVSNSSTHSSGFASPTSKVELLLGIDYNANTAEVPSPGGGYTLETSSTVGNTTQVFVEDQSEYISGQVAGTWSYLGTPSSTAMIATFY